jgi:hypothetical protein
VTAAPEAYIHWAEPSGPDIAAPYANASCGAPSKMRPDADTT